MNADQSAQLTISGAGTIAGVGGGKSQESYSGNASNLFHGRALVVLRTTRKADPAKLTTSADGSTASSLVVEPKSVEPKSVEPLAELR